MQMPTNVHVRGAEEFEFIDQVIREIVILPIQRVSCVSRLRSPAAEFVLTPWCSVHCFYDIAQPGMHTRHGRV
jgi:hypothetical protein